MGAETVSKMCLWSLGGGGVREFTEGGPGLMNLRRVFGNLP